MTTHRRLLAPFFLFPFSFFLSTAPAADWIHWRGPEQTGHAREAGLPETFDPNAKPGEGGVVWKQPFGGRSAPLVLKGRLYAISGYDMAKPTEGERVLCFDAETGEKKWEQRFNVFHTDIVSSRLGWTTLAADPEKEYVYCHSTAGFLTCFDRDGKEVWRRQLTEEFGRVSGYGGRIVSPVFDSGLVIVGMVNSSWGEQARGLNRFVALDGANGHVVWWAEATEAMNGTYYSSPVVAVIGGRRQLVTGGADGGVHGFDVRTGERLWSYVYSAGVINPSPVVDGSLVYISHGEENLEGGPIGRVVCVDAAQVDPQTKTPKVVWEQKGLGKRFGLASPVLADGRLYVPDDASELYCFNAKTGRVLWRERYGPGPSRGAPLVADGKLYVFDVNARLSILGLNGDKAPDVLDEVTFRRTAGPGFVETHGTPIAVNGKLYFLTQDALYCVHDPEKKGAAASAGYKPLPEEAPAQPGAAPAAIRVYPADVTARPGESLHLTVKFLDANGREVPAPAGAKVEWSLPLPPKVPSGAQPPALVGEAKADGVNGVVVLGKNPAQQGSVLAKAGNLTARARVRVAAEPPFTTDFEKVPVGAGPSGWVNASALKYVVADVGGNKVLSKTNVNSRPPFARANGYMTGPNAADYTVEADVMGTEVRGWFPDMGVVNARYTLILDGKADSPNGKRQLRVVSWEARMRVNEAVEFDWQPGTWYRVKLTTDPASGTVRAKAWKKGDAEPAAWMIDFKDPSPNREGAAAVYAYISDPSISPENPGSNVYFDNVTITPNGKK